MESKLRGLNEGQENWDKMKNFFQDTVEITITERIYTKVVHRQAKYRLKDEVNTTGKEVIITAPGPVKIKPGCTYSVDFALAVVSDKYEFHMPLERQRRKMESAGLEIDVKTLYSLCKNVAEHCETILPQIQKDLFNDFCALHLDESPWPIIGGDRTSYMWAVSNRLGSYYRFEPTRSGKVALEILEGYKGAVLTDGFAGYNRIKGHSDYRVGHCWAHARREFYDRWDDYPKETEQIIRLIDQLFSIETKAKTFEELRTLRKVESQKVADEIYSLLLNTKARFLPSEGITSAINYCLKFWKELTLFLKDLSLDLSNNDAERALRHIVMGRKNFGGSKTIDGADVAATLYTVIETAKKVGLQPKHYLKYLITERWHRRVPLSPLGLSHETLGVNKRITFPSKSDWEIK
jgi:transposase